MNKKSTAVAIGSFILGGGILLALGIIMFGGVNLFSGRERAVIFFESSVSGLQVGAPVTFRGVTIGSVHRLALEVNASSHSARIPVYIEIDTGNLTVTDEGATEPLQLEQLVGRGLRARLQTQSFVTGRLMLELDFVEDAGPVTVAHVGGIPEIPAVKSRLDQIKEEVSELDVGKALATATRVLDTVEKLAVAADEQVNRIGNSVVTTSDSADRLIGTVEGTIKTLEGEVTLTMEELRKLADTTREQVNSRGDQLGTLIARLERSADEIDTATASVKQMLEPRGPVRSDLQSGLRDLAAAASSLRSFAREIERNPNSLLLGSQ